MIINTRISPNALCPQLVSATNHFTTTSGYMLSQDCILMMEWLLSHRGIVAVLASYRTEASKIRPRAFVLFVGGRSAQWLDGPPGDIAGTYIMAISISRSRVNKSRPIDDLAISGQNWLDSESSR